MYKIVVTDEQGTSQMVPLMDLEQAWVGRDPVSDVVLDEKNISRKHVRIWKTEGRVFIEDASRFGTKLNNVRISKPESIVEGDVIRVGDFYLTLQVETSKSLDIQAIPGFSGGDTKSVGRLVMLAGPLPGHQILLPELGKEFSRLFIGRSNDSEVKVEHRSISRKHVEIVCDKGVYQIRDLGSANGTQVNGREIYQVNLNPGDLIEIGKVRFRYVAPGQPYEFKKDPEAHSTQSKFPVGQSTRMIGVAVFLLLLLGVVWFFWDSSGLNSTELNNEETQEIESEKLIAVEEQRPLILEESKAVDQKIEECFEAIREQKIDVALSILDTHGDDKRFISCKQKVDGFQNDLTIFNRGKELYQKKETDAAISTWLTLSPDSPLRGRSLISSVTESHVVQYLLETEDGELSVEMKSRLQKFLTYSPFLSEQIQEELRARLKKVPKSKSSPKPKKKNRRKTLKNNHSSPPPKPVTPEPRKEEKSQFEIETPFQKARDCLRSGDNECAIRALRGKANTARELALLIATYRQVGNSQAATQYMKQFVSKYPNDRRAIRFKKLLTQP